jgi:tRNA uridine 5-carboxymethylaminomethyl modification enzyme
LASAIGSTLAQLLKRPEIVIEDLAAVVREKYPEFFAEIDYAVDDAKASDLAPANGSGAGPSPRRSIEHEPEAATAAASVRDGISLIEASNKIFAAKLSSAARNEMKTVETEIKYAGYLDQQRKSIERLKKAEQRVIPDWFDYGKVSGLSREMNEKLQRVRPRTLGHASRIPGVTPAAVSLINVYIEIQAKRFSLAQQSAG